MNVLQQFEAVCHAMADPDFYPHPVSCIERRDTHISSVFLTGKWVYKLKKPFDLGFLDFRSLEDRYRFCKLEVSLNRRFSRNIYQEVIRIYKSDDGRFSLLKNEEVVEYAVKMRQLPDSTSLKALLKKNKIRSAHMKKLGKTLAAFYEKSNRNSEIDHYGRRDIISFNMEENFRQLKPFAGDVPDREKFEFICNAGRSFLEQHSDLFEHRVETGKIRDGHGDLRTEHVYFYRGIQIIDCIEFNERFRYGDVAADLAFLHMDMEHMGFANLSRIFLEAYVAAANDPELYALLDFYAAYRAMVRAKVSWIRFQEVEDDEKGIFRDDARHYMDQAYRYAIQLSRPTLWIFCGLPATGKSSLAEMVAKKLSISLFQSDRVRKEMQPDSHQKVVPFGQGIYRSEIRDTVYTRLSALAGKILAQRDSVILDATFSRRKWRDEVGRLAMSLDADFIFVECVCKEDTIRSRLKRRERETSVSDARIQHLSQMIKGFEPLAELDLKNHLKIDTDLSLDDAFSKILSQGYECKREQVKTILIR